MIQKLACSQEGQSKGSPHVKGMSVQHYLIRMSHLIISSVFISRIDWSQELDRYSHKIGLLSFIDKGVLHTNSVKLLSKQINECKIECKIQHNQRRSRT